MIKAIATVVLYAIEWRASAMINAQYEFGEISESDTVWRFWRAVGDVGYALQDWVGGVDERYDLDLSSYMIDRAYGR